MLFPSNHPDSNPDIKVLPPWVQSADSNPQKSVPVLEVKPSRKVRFILSLYKLGLYGFWFSTGVAAANITRLFKSGWVVYLAFCASAVGTIMLTKPTDATPEILSLRRMSGLALAVSIVALWDGLIVTANLPIKIGFWIFPAWLVLLCTIALLLGAWMTLSASTQQRG
ncbi:MAG TPA: hypothetical protein V6D33_05395 [Cyanophyceae cyanobacterium]